MQCAVDQRRLPFETGVNELANQHEDSILVTDDTVDSHCESQ